MLKFVRKPTAGACACPSASTSPAATIRAPSSIVEVELNAPLPELGVDPGRPLLVVAKLCGVTIGTLVCAWSEVCAPAGLARTLAAQLGREIRSAANAHRLELPPAVAEHEPLITAAGLVHEHCPVRIERERLRAHGEPFSIVVCTRERPELLAILLDSLAALDYHAFEVVVVDNAPRTRATAEAVQSARSAKPQLKLRYLVEPQPGLSRARNTGIDAAVHELIAFVDDDERLDRDWLSALAVEFQDRGVGCVGGLVLPAELDTQAQVDFERFGGHSKARGFQRVKFDARYLREHQPAMYPLPPFGVGANMAFRRAALTAIDGFDIALGAGTPTCGAEDTRAFTELLLAGWEQVYVPAALVWHSHRVTDGALRAQLDGYGRALGAYYTSMLVANPLRIWGLLKLVPRAWHDLHDPQSTRNASFGDLPPEITGANLNPRSLAAGATAYLRLVVSRWMTAR